MTAVAGCGCASFASRALMWNTGSMRYAYPATFSEAPDGVSVTFADVPEAITWGSTRKEATKHAADALISALSVYVEDNWHSPKPSAARGRELVAVTALEAMKLALHDAMLEAKVSDRKLAARLALEEKAVRGLRDPLQRSAIDDVEAALRCLGKRVDVSVMDAA